MDNVPLNIVHFLVLLCLGAFLLVARSFRFWRLLVSFILLQFLRVWFRACNPELGIPAPHKMNEESELPQTGPHGSECSEQRDSFAGW